MGFYDKLKWVLGILMVFILIVATNLIDRNNFLQVKDSVSTIYEDRLVANDLIFQMANVFHLKEIATIQSDTTFFSTKNENYNLEIASLLNKFEQTKLTNEEATLFDNLKKNIDKLKQEEVLFIQSKYKDKSFIIRDLSGAKEKLTALSKIQLSEGDRQASISKKAIDTVELFTHIEIYFLVFLAIIIQVIVMYNPKGKENI